jgi:hypothetical protein
MIQKRNDYLEGKLHTGDLINPIGTYLEHLEEYGTAELGGRSESS